MKTTKLISLAGALAIGALAGAACDVENVDERGGDYSKGCTYTQGWWKNHNRHETRRNQQVPWPNNGFGITEDTEFYGCGYGSWLDVFNTPPEGSPYFILAHQYMAAKLNFFNGAHAPGLTDMLWDAYDILIDCEVDADEFEEAMQLAEDFDAFNNGEWGPGHCD